MAEYEKLCAFFTSEFVNIAGSTVLCAGYLAVCLYYSPTLFLALLVILPAIGFLSFHLSRSLNLKLSEVFNLRSKNIGFVAEIIQGISTIKSIGAHSRVHARWTQQISVLIEKHGSINKNQIMVEGILFFIQHVGFLGSLVYVMNQIADSQLSTGGAFALLLVVSRLSDLVTQIMSQLPKWKEVKIGLEKVQDVFDERTERDAHSTTKIHDRAPSIEIRKLQFSHVGQASKLILRSVDLILEPGTMTALIGASGGGKSSLLHLIQGDYKPTSGQLLINGVPSQELSLSEIRKEIAMATQEPHLFGGTILENITGLEENPDLEKAMHCIQQVHLLDLIESLPRGIHSFLAEGGIGLSGGQKQLISIARLLYRNSRILLLDEATSSLDLETEQRVLDSFSKVKKDKVILIATHRPAALEHADRILQLRNGLIKEINQHGKSSFLGVA